MKRFTKDQGITLIALIITIIVMLILVAVTINVALNGGLFSRAKEAAFKTEIQQIQEQIALKKAEQAADNEINGTTGYNITLDNLGISTELKNKYRNKLSVSSTGDLQYNEDNCTAEEKAYLASIGAKSGTAPVTSKLEFDVKSIQIGDDDEFDEFSVAKYIFEDGNFYWYVEFEEDGNTYEGNLLSGIYTYTINTEDYKEGMLTVTTMYDFDENEEIELEDDYQESVPFQIIAIKENGQVINNAFVGQGSGITAATTNGTAGLEVPDSSLIGNYINEEDKVISIGLNQAQTMGQLTVIGQTNVSYDIYIINTGNKEYVFMGYGMLEITRDANNGTITINVGDDVYTKSGN